MLFDGFEWSENAGFLSLEEIDESVYGLEIPEPEKEVKQLTKKRKQGGGDDDVDGCDIDNRIEVESEEIVVEDDKFVKIKNKKKKKEKKVIQNNSELTTTG